MKVPKVALGIAGALAAAVLAERVAAKRLRSRVDPDVDPLLRLPLDVTHHHVDTSDGGVIHVVERGEGRPLVLLHGVTLAAAIWSPQLHNLAGAEDLSGFRVLALDLRGHGDSRAGTGGWGLSVLARDLAEVLEALDLRDAIVVGHSMGGMTVMQFASDHPEVMAERVAGLTFVATAAFAPVHPLVLERVKVLAAKAIDRLDDGRPYPQLKFSGNDLSLLTCRLAFGKDPSAAAVEQVRACVEAMDPDAFQRSWLGILDHDVRDSLGTLTLPAAIVVGSRDLLTPVSAAKVIAELLPDAEFNVLRDCGHQVMQERPAELELILRNLAERIGVSTTP